MADPERTPPASSPEPDWPERGANRVLFLIDASSRLERRILEDWVHRRRPEGVAESDYERIPIPSSRRRRKRLDRRLEAALAAEGDALCAPLRVAWLPPLRNGQRSVQFSDLLTFGDPRDPGRLRQAWVRRRHPDRCRIVTGEPALVSELRRRWRDAGWSDTGLTTGLAGFVARQATLALERAERRLRGARYKVPRLVEEEVLGRPAFRGELARLARQQQRSEAAAFKETSRYLREIAATHSPFVIDLVARLIHQAYTLGYGESLQYDRKQLAAIAILVQQHPVVFLPAHRSNLDHLVLQYALHENGLPPNHTAGGINMNFLPVGPLVRRSGVFFIRRGFRDNPTYKLVLRSYIDYLIEKRFSLEWYIEGGRSRLGKLLPPNFGLLAYVADAYRRGKSDDVYLIPVSIAYDQIQDVGSYVAEQRGGTKQKESLGWFIGVIRALRRRYGNIHIRFGEPLSLRSYLGPSDPGAGPNPDERSLALQKLAFEVSVRINRSTAITPTSLVTLALLGRGDRAVTLEETRATLSDLIAYVEKRKLPTTVGLDPLRTNEGVRTVLDGLVENGVASCFTGGPEAVYMIGPDQQLAAAYYRNSVVHFFVNGAIAELALLRAGESDVEEPLSEFWKEAMRLRDLMKFEFFFADKETYRDELRDEITFHEPGWEEKLVLGAAGVRQVLHRFRPFSAHRVLRPFLESYRVVSDQLARWDPAAPLDVGRFLAACLGLGKQYRLQRLINSADSVSKVLFQTALRLAQNRGLLEGEPPDLAARRQAFATEIRDVLRRVEAVDALAASRLAGLFD